MEKRKRSGPKLRMHESPLARRYGPYLLCGLITLLVTVLYLDNHRLFATVELAIQDVMVGASRNDVATNGVVIVNIDDEAVNKLGPWPWDAERVGYIVGMLNEYRPKAIGLDLELPTEFASDPAGNLFLAEMVRQSGRVVVPMSFTLARRDTEDDRSWTGTVPPGNVARSSLVAFDDARRLLDMPYLEGVRVTFPYSELCDAALSMGHVNSWQDVDGIVRRDPIVVRYAGDYYPSMPLQLARAAMSVDRTQVKIVPGQGITLSSKTIPTDDAGLSLIDFRGPSGNVPSISAARVLEGEAPVDLIAEKIVIVGVTATGYGTGLETGIDVGMARTEKIAQVTANIVSGRFVDTLSLSTILDILVMILIGVFCAAVLPRVTLMYRVITLVLMAFVFLNLNFVLYSSFKLLTQTVFPTLEIVLFLAFAAFIRPVATDAVPVGKAARTAGPQFSVSSDDLPHAIAKPVTHTPNSARSSSGSVPVRNLDREVSPQIISGLEKTSTQLPATPTPPRAASQSSPSIPPVSVPPKTGEDVPEIVSPVAMDDSAVFGTHQPLADIPDSSDPQPRDLMEVTPQPMGLSDSDPRTAEIRTRPSREVLIKQLGRYEILGILGEGAMGTVYKGKDPAIDRLVALKTIRAGIGADPEHAAELRERLVREAKAAGKLSHPNIVTIYDVGAEGELNYIAMEYLEGYTLEQVVRKKVQLNYRIAARILVQVCEALEYAHTSGIVHRDIKPANIMVLDNFKIKVTDFGIARFDSPHMSMTQTGIAVGTPQYIAPELLRGEEIDRRCDIFSLGVVAYELLTHRRPFIGENISQLIYAITQTNPDPPTKVDPNIPGLFDVIVNKALAKDRHTRYQTAKEFGNALRAFVDEIAGSKSFRI
jgi:serine/threonine-protein kinase